MHDGIFSIRREENMGSSRAFYAVLQAQINAKHGTKAAVTPLVW